MKLARFLFFTLLLFFVAACRQNTAEQPATDGLLSAVDSTATPLPTPTLQPNVTLQPPTPFVTPQPPPTATPFPTPTPPPNLEDRLPLGLHAFDLGDYDTAVTHLSFVAAQPDAFPADQWQNALLVLGRAYLENGRFTEAADTFTQLLALPEPPTAIQHLLGQALEGTGDTSGALTAYRSYLAANPDMAAYVNLDIARLATDPAEIVAAYEAALSSPSQRLHEVAIRLQLADFYNTQGNMPAAIEQYLAVRDLAKTEATQGQMTYLAGMAYLQAGNAEAAYEQFALGITAYPRAYESYLGLIELINAGIPVDNFQRGLVDYYAGAYEPAIAAFEAVIAQTPDNYRPDVHKYLAFCYEALGNAAEALAQMDLYVQQAPEDGLIAQAQMLARLGDSEGALAAYEAYLVAYPEGLDAEAAAWQTAVLHEQRGDIPKAISAYQQLAAQYPQADDAPEALFRAGWLSNEQGDWETAVSLWWQTAQKYAAAEYGSAAIVWLLRTLPAHPTPDEAATETAAAPTAPAATLTPTQTMTATTPVPTPDWAAIRQEVTAIGQRLGLRTDYYGLRAYHVAHGVEPFQADTPMTLPTETAVLQTEAETWLREQLALDPGTDIATLDPILQNDPRLQIGTKLWDIGRLEDAKAELEQLRRETASSALYSYQLALYFREMGLYRSSIIAANSVLVNLRTSVFNAPRFLGQLAYPVYYADVIMPLAEKYGYDPRLQFALVRQESLFESFARSGAAAQGLSQVIPDTGAYIARRLGWPEFENADLYKPYVGLNFGAFYLAEQLGQFDEFVAAALAAYNAGPGNAAFWMDKSGPDHDLFVETVTFSETRLYVERIYLGYFIYAFLYGA